ncbi:MAG: hypothetical protein J6V09_00625 [Clostridia bacterium]|nr:hypothetical protein [Clostridia bacterium]
MATWQFDFDLVAKDKQNITISNESLEKLAKVFPLRESWHDDLKMYGKDYESSLVNIWEEEGSIEISCRLSLIDVSKQQALAIIDFAKDNNLLFSVDAISFDPTLENLKNLISSSSAYKFTRTPIDFFNQLTDNS